MTRKIAAMLLAACTTLSAATRDLQIVPLDGEHAVHDSAQGVGRSTVVQVRDGSGRLAPGVEVTFSAPEAGPGGRFADGSYRRSVVTGADGRAVMNDFTPNQAEGPFSLVVTARAQGAEETIVLRQSNRGDVRDGGAVMTALPRKSGGFSKKLLIILGVGAAVTAIGVSAAGGGSSNASPGAAPNPTATIDLGGVTVGAPQ